MVFSDTQQACSDVCQPVICPPPVHPAFCQPTGVSMVSVVSLVTMETDSWIKNLPHDVHNKHCWTHGFCLGVTRDVRGHWALVPAKSALRAQEGLVPTPWPALSPGSGPGPTRMHPLSASHPNTLSGFPQKLHPSHDSTNTPPLSKTLQGPRSNLAGISCFVGGVCVLQITPL